MAELMASPHMKTMHPRSRVSGIVASILLAGTLAQGATIVLSPSKDNTLYESDTGSLSNGQGDLFVGKTGENDNFHIRRGLIAFDLSAIPAGSTINSVSLSLFVSKTAPVPSLSVNVSLHVALKYWGEGTSVSTGAGAPAATGDATWLHNFYDTSFWTNPGGDFRQTVSAITTVGQSSGRYTWVGGTLNGDVQAWVNNPASNFGWFIRGAENIDQSAIRIISGESPSNVPQLTVMYTIPEPSSALLLTAGCALGAVRRRTSPQVE